MKHFLLTVVILGLLSCEVGEKDPFPGNVTKTLVPKAEDIASDPDLIRKIDEAGSDQIPKVPLEPDEVLCQLLNINLDLDKTTEQILVLKSQSDNAAPIRVAVVDFDEIRNSYLRTWEHLTQASNQRAFRLEVEDIVGDYNSEIICHGLNHAGELTLDVFRKTTSPSGLGLYFAPICQVNSDRTITINRHERSQSYHVEQKTGDSFPIIVERKDPESDNLMDILKETYYWKYQDKRYVKIQMEKITGDRVIQDQLKELFYGSSRREDFDNFLEGPWFQRGNVALMVLFNSDNEAVSFYDGQILETYLIESLTHHGNRLNLNTRNNTIRTITQWINITMDSLNSITIVGSTAGHTSVQNSEHWEGKYDRLSQNMQESLLQKQASPIQKSDLELSGIYHEGGGLEIAFEPPYFTWIEDDEMVRSGGYCIISNVPFLNSYYLEREVTDSVEVVTFRFLQESGIFVEDIVYIFEYSETSEGSSLVRTLMLTPGKLTIRGVSAVTKNSLVLEQVEILDLP